MNISLFIWLWPVLVALLLLVAASRYEWAWKRRRLLAEAVIGLQVASLPFLFTTDYGLALQVFLALMQGGVALLAGRLLFGRLPVEFLRTSTHFNSVLALGIVVVSIDVWLLSRQVDALKFEPEVLVSGLLCLSVLGGLGFLYQALWTLKHYRIRKIDSRLGLKDLPTLTLAIPARNEDHALEACLQAAIASDYPKLEIIVFDDCSQDKTSEIIRAYANSGVRFVQGDEPADGWLGKNQAMRTLAEQASGDYIVFVDVDTHLAPDSLTQLVLYALSNRLDMVSVLPERRDGLSMATLLPPLRIFWQIGWPVTARHVPVASQCWLIRRPALAKLGAFDAVRQKVVPEGFFASQLFTRDAYRFVIANHDLRLTTAKRWNSQAETAIRLLYPACKRQPFVVLLACLVLFVVVLLPFVVLALATGPGLPIAAAVATGLWWLSYSLVIARIQPLSWPLTMLLLPLSLVQELILLIASMLMYEFGDVNWKGRNVCYPVLRRP